MVGNVTRVFASPFVSHSTMPSAFPKPTPLGMLLHYLRYREKLMIPQHSGGGADGSIITFKNIELQNGANTNLNGIIQALENLLSRSRSGGIDISAGDMWVLAHSSTTQL
jgi:hypothetical protein